MKIIQIITGLNNGGAEAVMQRLVIADQQNGNQHHVISLMSRGIYADKLEQAGAKVYTLNFPRGRFSFMGLVKLFRLIRQIKPDVVQTWMYHADLIGGLVARFAGVGAIAWGIRNSNLDPAYNSRSTLTIVRLCALLSRWVPRQIVSCSERATEVHQAAGYKAHKFVQVPNGYNLAHLQSSETTRNTMRTELGLTSDVFVIGMVARFDVQKDHRNLIRALAVLKSRDISFVCLLVGVNMIDANNELCSWIQEADITDNVRLLGPRSDIPAVMNALDVHVLSSLGEAFPNVLAEAMACGTPCVTTDVGDAALIVANHGWIVAPQNADALASGLIQALESFSENKDNWKVRQEACRAHIIENFELEQMVQRYRAVWQLCMQP